MPFAISSRRATGHPARHRDLDQADRQGIAQPLAGKTGTTSNYFDAWFVGFSPDLVAGAYVGFDEPRTLGDGETGGRVAAGIFRDFIHEALKGAPAHGVPGTSGGARD